MAESLVRVWGCVGKVEGNFSLNLRSSTISGRGRRRPLQLLVDGSSCAPKELRLELLGLRPQQQSGVGRVRGGREKTGGKWRNTGMSGSSSKWMRRASTSGGEMGVQSLTKSSPQEKHEAGAQAQVEESGTACLTQYNDSYLEVTAIEFLTSRIASITGRATELKGYDGFVDITKKFVRGRPAKQQRETIRDLLLKIVPGWLLVIFRLVPKTKFVTEVFAQVTSIFFKWLVGASEIREGEVNGVSMKNTVHVKKCRYLEQSQCVGSCVNLCKSPTQEFISQQLGMPLTMKPNFEDLSCDMIYGVHPPPLEEDPAYQQPCISICNSTKMKVIHR